MLLLHFKNIFYFVCGLDLVLVHVAVVFITSDIMTVCCIYGVPVTLTVTKNMKKAQN